jgi:hypothetical protein
MKSWKYKTTSKSMKAFKKQLKKKKNLHLIDSGAFASVYGNDKDDVVYKLGYYDSEENDGYLTYLKAIAGKDNPIFPKIHKVTLYTVKDSEGIITDNFYVVKMERLKEFNPGLSTPAFAELYRELKAHQSYQDRPVTKLKKNRHIATIPEIKPVLKMLKNLAVGNFCADWHEDNMMMRENGHLVITDPIS